MVVKPVVKEIGKSAHNVLNTNFTREIRYLDPYFNDTLAGPLVPAMALIFAALLNEKRAPETTENIDDAYDYIIVGAGSGGSTLAARLTEESCIKVLLLEAGGNPPVLSEVPALNRNFMLSDIDWSFYTVPQRFSAMGLRNRSFPQPGGKVLGGSSIINTMLHVRGHWHIYDEWAKQGAIGWNFDKVLPYFKKLEDNQNPELVEPEFHGFHGPVTVTKPTFNTIFKSATAKSFANLGYHPIDVNGRYERGIYDYQSTTRNGQRCSVAKAYLVPAEKRKNLHIKAHALVIKVLIKGNRAYGIKFEHNGKKYEVFARKEVIVSAGTINTPKLLMLSGIGPKEHLEEMGIPVIANLPGVGQNFQDHTAAFASYYTEIMPDFLNRMLFTPEVEKYILFRTGIFASSFIQYVAFLTNDRNASKDAIPDYELYFSEGVLKLIKYTSNIRSEVYDQVFKPYEKVASFWCVGQNLHSRSRGVVKLNSKDPHDPPYIDPRYLSAPQDIIDSVEALKECDRVVLSEPFKKIGVKPYKTLYPSCEKYADDRTAYLTCQVKIFQFTVCHPAGTSKMGNPHDPTTVVDPQLRVKGIHNLRVVDASVMPQIPSGNINAATIMIAEKAADMIKATIPCHYKHRKDFKKEHHDV